MYQSGVWLLNREAVATGSLNGTSARIDGSAWLQGVYVVAIETAVGKRMVYKIQW